MLLQWSGIFQYSSSTKQCCTRYQVSYFYWAYFLCRGFRTMTNLYLLYFVSAKVLLPVKCLLWQMPPWPSCVDWFYGQWNWRFIVCASTFGKGASDGRSFVGGNHPNSLVTEEGLTIVVVRGNICEQTVSMTK